MFASRRSAAKRVALWLRLYSKPLWTPGLSWMKVLLVKIGGITAPVPGSGLWPPWMTRESRWRLPCAIGVFREAACAGS